MRKANHLVLRGADRRAAAGGAFFHSVANADTGNVSVLVGVGDGTFRPAQNFVAGRGPSSLVAADFNGDDLPDLAVTNAGSNNVSVLLNTTPRR